MKTGFLTFISLLAFVPTITAQVTLEIKHQEESKVIERSDISVAQNLQMAGQEVITKNKQVIITEHVTGTRAKNGNFHTKATIINGLINGSYPVAS